jgi:hypothetical protein
MICSLNLNTINAQKLALETSVKNTIHTFFEGLHTGDTLIINTCISKSAKLETVYTRKTGETVVKSIAKKDFFNAIASKPKKDTWEEKLGKFTIHIDKNIASVWVPYKFYLNTTFSHCGVNSFQLIKQNGTWKISYLVDTRRKKECI